MPWPSHPSIPRSFAAAPFAGFDVNADDAPPGTSDTPGARSALRSDSGSSRRGSNHNRWSAGSLPASDRDRRSSFACSIRSRRLSFVLQDPDFAQAPVSAVSPAKRDYWKRVRVAHKWEHGMAKVVVRAAVSALASASVTLRSTKRQNLFSPVDLMCLRFSPHLLPISSGLRHAPLHPHSKRQPRPHGRLHLSRLRCQGSVNA